jgi:hypothetical protein
MVRDQVGMVGVANGDLFVLPAQSNAQGDCLVAIASSSCDKPQDAYDKLNCIDGKGSPCSTVPLEWDEFHVKNSYPVSFFFLGNDGNFHVANITSVANSKENTIFSPPVIIQLRNVPFLSAL